MRVRARCTVCVGLSGDGHVSGDTVLRSKEGKIRSGKGARAGE